MGNFELLLDQHRELEQARRLIAELHAEIAQLRVELESTRAVAAKLAKSDQLIRRWCARHDWLARASAQTLEATLRVRLLIDPSAHELHQLHWETLRDPQDGALLFSGENIVFSRYLSSYDWRPIRLRPQADLKALIVVANPSGLD